jgi:hypothetical protein
MTRGAFQGAKQGGVLGGVHGMFSGARHGLKHGGKVKDISKIGEAGRAAAGDAEESRMLWEERGRAISEFGSDFKASPGSAIGDRIKGVGQDILKDLTGHSSKFYDANLKAYGDIEDSRKKLSDDIDDSSKIRGFKAARDEQDKSILTDPAYPIPTSYTDSTGATHTIAAGDKFEYARLVKEDWNRKIDEARRKRMTDKWGAPPGSADRKAMEGMVDSIVESLGENTHLTADAIGAMITQFNTDNSVANGGTGVTISTSGKLTDQIAEIETVLRAGDQSSLVMLNTAMEGELKAQKNYWSNEKYEAMKDSS